jgi:hypothetical protein
MAQQPGSVLKAAWARALEPFAEAVARGEFAVHVPPATKHEPTAEERRAAIEKQGAAAAPSAGHTAAVAAAVAVAARLLTHCARVRR